MTINEKTAQLIFDAICWCNRDWIESLDWETSQEEFLRESRMDFVRFCNERGIEDVKVVHEV